MSDTASASLASADESFAVTIGKNTLFGVIAKIAQVATRLVTVPFVIEHLGLGGYGIWSIIMTMAAYMRFGSIGAKSAFQKYVAEATGNGEYEQASRLLSTGSAAMLALSVVGLIPIAFFSRDLAKAGGVPQQFLGSAAGAISVLAVILLFSNGGAAFEAIVTGGHRIDLARKFTTFFTIAEAVAIVAVLFLGKGLFTMATIMGVSEIGFVACCYWASRKVVPQVRVAWKYVTKDVLGELFRYAGSYQLVSVLAILYQAIVPVALLRTFGAELAGLYALASRLQTSAQMLPDAFIVPVLSGGARIYSSGSRQEMERLLRKSFKITLALSLLPLCFIAVFGTRLIRVWTGQVNPLFQPTLDRVCITGLFLSFSILGVVLYRISGHALLDNVRQVICTILLLTITAFAMRLGFEGVLTGLAATEFVGAAFMVFAVAKTFRGFRAESLFSDVARLAITAALTLAVGVLVSRIPLPAAGNGRATEALRLCLVGVAAGLALWPVLTMTGSVTREERRTFLRVLSLRKLSCLVSASAK